MVKTWLVYNLNFDINDQSMCSMSIPQVVHDVDLQKLPVRFALDRAGLVGADGPTHSGSFDVTYMACLPNMVVMAPSDEAELFHMVATAAAINDRPSCFRYPRGNGVGVVLPPGNRGTPLEVSWEYVYIHSLMGTSRNNFPNQINVCVLTF